MDWARGAGEEELEEGEGGGGGGGGVSKTPNKFFPTITALSTNASERTPSERGWFLLDLEEVQLTHAIPIAVKNIPQAAAPGEGRGTNY